MVAFGDMALQSPAAPLAGVALVNGTPNITSWTVPNDGNIHRVMLVVGLAVSVLEVGGQVSVTFTDPAGTARTKTVFAAALGTGYQTASLGPFQVGPNETVTIAQSTALTGGAAVLWAEIWGV